MLTTVKIIKKANPKHFTLRQEKVVAMVGNGGKSKASILREAGYSSAVVNNPKKVFNSLKVQEAIDPIISSMKDQQTKALKRMEETVSKASYGNAVLAVSILTKSIESLEDRPISFEKHELSDEEKARLDKLFKMNSQI